MSSEETVTEIINSAREFANASYENAADLINSAQTAAMGFSYVNPRPLRLNTDAVGSLDETLRPGRFGDSFKKPWGRPEFNDDLQTIPIPTLPDFPDPPPELNTEGLFDIDRPALDFGGFEGTNPDINLDVQFPAKVEVREYDAPETTELQLRDTPEVTVPTFDPDLDYQMPGEAPDVTPQYRIDVENSVAQFRDWVETHTDAWVLKHNPKYYEAMDQLEAALQRGYEGNTAMPDSVERQLFDRGVERAEAQRVQMDDEASERYARRGYKIMPVALGGQLARNQEVVARATADVAREVAIERAKLEHQHVQFVMQLSSAIREGIRGNVIQYAGVLLQTNQQAMEFAKHVGDYILETYRLTLDRARLQFDHMRTIAAIYETQMKAALADIEVFKIEMEAAKARKDAELADVDVWTKKIDAENTKINLYLAELRGVSEQLNAEKLKIDVFGEEVSAYTALVQAKSAEFSAYKAAIDGDAALVDAYSQQVRTYSAQVDAARTKVQAESAASSAVVEYNKGLIDIFRAELSGYTADIDAEAKRFDASSDAYRSSLDAYKTHLTSKIEELKLEYDRSRLELQAAIAQNESDVKIAMNNAQLFTERMKLRANTTMAGATAFGDMGAAGVAAQNTMVQLVNETLNGG